MSESTELNVLREQIDQVDYQIHELLNKRAALSLDVSRVKIKYGGPNVEFYRPERERVILERVQTHNKGPLEAEAVRDIFENIVTSCRKLQQRTYGKLL